MRRLLILCLLLSLNGCPRRSADAQDAGLDAGPDSGLDGSTDAGVDSGVDGGPDAGIDAGPDAGPDAGFDVYLPGYHQGIRFSQNTPPANNRVTYRLKIPLSRGGDHLRIAFRAGNGACTLFNATVGLATAKGSASLINTPITLTFGGQPGHLFSARERTVSDPVALSVTASTEIAVSFEIAGSIASSAINLFPDGFIQDGGLTQVVNYTGSTANLSAAGIDTVELLGPPQPSFVAIGDSITEGYSSGSDDYRNTWPFLAGQQLGFPLLNEGVSGEGVQEAAAHLDAEVFTLKGVTDCIVLLGTNDLSGTNSGVIIGWLDGLFNQLRPFCRVTAATLLPKESVGSNQSSSLALVNQRRRDVNEWLRNSAVVSGLIDFEAALRRPELPNSFVALPTRWVVDDGIHPSVAGLGEMAAEATRVLGAGPMLFNDGFLGTQATGLNSHWTVISGAWSMGNAASSNAVAVSAAEVPVRCSRCILESDVTLGSAAEASVYLTGPDHLSQYAATILADGSLVVRQTVSGTAQTIAQSPAGVVDVAHPVRLRFQVTPQDGLALDVSVANQAPVHLDLSVGAPYAGPFAWAGIAAKGNGVLFDNYQVWGH